jgi:hypothetical protein
LGTQHSELIARRLQSLIDIMTAIACGCASKVLSGRGCSNAAGGSHPPTTLVGPPCAVSWTNSTGDLYGFCCAQATIWHFGSRAKLATDPEADVYQRRLRGSLPRWLHRFIRGCLWLLLNPEAFDGVCDHQGFTNLSVMRSDSPMACIVACSASGPDRSGGSRCTMMSSGSLGLALISETPATRKPVLSASAIR